MTADDPPSNRKQVTVAVLQWGLTQAFLLDSVGTLTDNYYRATTDSFFPLTWVSLIQFAVPLGLLVGGYGGYRWLKDGYGAATPTAHASRVRFVGTLVAGWALAIVPAVAFQWVLGDRLFTVPYFLLPSLVSVAVFGGAYLVAYRLDSDVYGRYRGELLGAVQGAIVGLVVVAVGISLYGEYLLATQTTFDLDGGPFVVGATVVGGLAGFRSSQPDDRVAEFLTLFLTTLFTVSLAVALTAGALAVAGIDLAGLLPFGLYPLLPLIFALGTATYLTYRVRTDLYRRVVRS